MSQPLDLSQVKFPDQMDLRTASIFLELTSARVRTLARTGDIPSTKTEDGKWSFTKAALTKWKDTPRKRASGGPRGDEDREGLVPDETPVTEGTGEGYVARIEGEGKP